MNVDTDLKIEKTTYPLTGEVEYQIVVREPVYKFNWKKLRFEEIGEKWVKQSSVFDAADWPIWTASEAFLTFESANQSLQELKNHYLRNVKTTEII